MTTITIKHARRIDDKNRVTLPPEFQSGEIVVIQGMDKDTLVIFRLTEPARHFVEADDDDSAEAWEVTAKDIESFYDPNKAW